jgi:hypothetical protein
MVDMTKCPVVPRKDRLRRVVILCCHFGRNLAYYRVGQSEQYQGQHHWRKIVTDGIVFKASLLNHLELDEANFQQYVDTMRTYRNKFVAHLDSDRTMNIPKLDVAKRAVWF